MGHEPTPGASVLCQLKFQPSIANEAQESNDEKLAFGAAFGLMLWGEEFLELFLETLDSTLGLLFTSLLAKSSPRVRVLAQKQLDKLPQNTEDDDVPVRAP